MFLSHWLYPVTVLGPGNRLCLWMRGCSQNCPRCISPEFRLKGKKQIPVQQLKVLLNQIIEKENLNGVTISGGEPFEQAEELFSLCSGLICDDILVYSGLSKTVIFSQFENSLLTANIAVLIAGPYIDSLNDNRPLIGSSNQEICYIKAALRQRYENYISVSERKIQQFTDESGDLFFAGIPPRNQLKNKYFVEA